MKARTPWYTYHEFLRDSTARLVGARPEEVVVMNTLTTNLHLMLASFYRPEGKRLKVVMEENAFPSDQYALPSHLGVRGVDPSNVVVARARAGEATLRSEDIERLFEEQGSEIAPLLLGEPITAASCSSWAGSRARLAAPALWWATIYACSGQCAVVAHDRDVDFALVPYKYLNGGPGAPGAASYAPRRDTSIARMGGWWGNDPNTRFQMKPEFTPRTSADGWQLSNPPILSMAPLRASMEIFDRAGFGALRASESLTPTSKPCWPFGKPMRVLTRQASPSAGASSPTSRGEGSTTRSGLEIVTDYREPDVVRMAPTPLYNSYRDVWHTANTVREILAG
jgi:kynureninase